MLWLDSVDTKAELGNFDVYVYWVLTINIFMEKQKKKKKKKENLSGYMTDPKLSCLCV